MKLFPKPVQRVDFLLSRCERKKVLHLGCTNWPYTEQTIKDGSLLHRAIAERSSELYGIDGDTEGLDVLREHGYENLYLGDLERLEECPVNETFDVVIAGEMIEHLNNPGLFLQGVKRFLGPDSTLVITTINAYCAMRFLIYGLRGKGGVREPVHPDHVAYFSYSTINLLLNRNRFSIEEFLFYDLGKEHRPYNRRIINFANDLAVWFSPQLSDGLIVVCSPSKLA